MSGLIANCIIIIKLPKPKPILTEMVKIVDKISQEARKKNMQAVRSKNTKLEEAVSKQLWRLGWRFRKNANKLFGRPDISIKKFKIVIFIDSCFWHGCIEHGTIPKTNTEFWKDKIVRNKERDRKVDDYYRGQGWKIIRIWEHDLKTDFVGVIQRINEIIENAKKYSTK